MKKIEPNDSLPKIWFLLSNVFPPIGIILYFKYRNQSPKKAKKALVIALISIPIGILMGFLFKNFIFS